VARYIRALVSSLRESPGIRLRVYRGAGPRVVGPHLLMPLRMRLEGADVLHGPANGLPVLRFGIRGVVTIQDLTIYRHPEWFPPRQWLSTRVLVPRSVREARIVIAPSQATRRDALSLFGVGADRVKVIPYGVETEYGLPVSEAVRSEVRRELDLPERYLLQVGTVQPRKNYETSLRALAHLPPAERVPLIAAGGFGWDFQPVLRLVQDLGLKDWVRFAGYIRTRHLPALYQMATAVLFPSLDEGFGLPVLEAFAAGTPVITSDAGALPEVAGDAALICPATDDVALAEHIRAVLRQAELRARLSAAGRARAMLYSWAICAAGHEAAYREAAA